MGWCPLAATLLLLPPRLKDSFSVPANREYLFVAKLLLYLLFIQILRYAEQDLYKVANSLINRENTGNFCVFPLLHKERGDSLYSAVPI